MTQKSLLPEITTHKEQERKWNKSRKTKKTSKMRLTRTHKKKLESQALLIIVAVVLLLFWIFLISYYTENGYNGKFLSIAKELTISLEKNRNHFEILGLEYHTSTPNTLTKRRPKLFSQAVWLLRPLKNGSITIKDISRSVHSPTHVSVLLKYYMSTPTKRNPSHPKITVTGRNCVSHEVVTIDMSQYGDGFCTRVLFLGLAHEVVIDASVPKNGGFVIIDELLIGLGYFVFDGLDEETCS